jgi:8-oxo-dGTP pyrophosphatase MutT (NUDIX family)
LTFVFLICSFLIVNACNANSRIKKGSAYQFPIARRLLSRTLKPMNALTPSTLAALEELLQNTARSVPSEYLPIFLAIPSGNQLGQTVGHLHSDFFTFLKYSIASSPIAGVRIESHRVLLEGRRPNLLSQTMRTLADRMRQGGFIPGWRNEEFAFIDAQGHALFQVERAAFRTFGFKSMASHINGFTENGQIWLGRRSENKQIDPGKWDNVSAGGISADETPWVCATRELWEEAGIPKAIANEIQPAGRMEMRRPTPPLGFHAESLFIYDLLLPSNLLPTNRDGEVAGFIAVSCGEAAARILADEFTADAALVTADFILRRSITKV